MGAAATIPAWAILSMIGAKVGGDVMTGIGAGQMKEAELKQRQKEMMAQIAMKNRQLDIEEGQFRESMREKRRESKEAGPSRVMETLGMIQSLGQAPATTADKLKYLIS